MRKTDSQLVGELRKQVAYYEERSRERRLEFNSIKIQNRNRINDLELEIFKLQKINDYNSIVKSL